MLAWPAPCGGGGGLASSLFGVMASGIEITCVIMALNYFGPLLGSAPRDLAAYFGGKGKKPAEGAVESTWD